MKLNKKQIQKKKHRAFQNKLRSYRKHISKVQQKPQYVINKNLQKIRVMNRRLNVVNINVNNTPSHERLKFEAALFLRQVRGFEILTEAIFTNGKRADIYIPFLDMVIEILGTEKPQDCLDKVKTYPVSQVIMLETKNGIKFNLDYLEKAI